MLTPNGYTEKVKYSLLLRFYAKEAPLLMRHKKTLWVCCCMNIHSLRKPIPP